MMDPTNGGTHVCEGRVVAVRRGSHGFVAALAAAGALALLGAGCGDSEDGESDAASQASQAKLRSDPELGGAQLIDAANKEGRLVLYTAQTVDEANGMAEAFEKDFPDIDVEVVRKSGAELFELVSSEARAGKLRADVMEQSDIVLALDLQEEFDLFEPQDSPSDAAFPDEYPVKAFYPVYEILHAFAYNTQLVDEADAPKTWEDYLDPAFNGRRAHVAAGGGGCSWALTLFQGKELAGEDHAEYWRKVAALNPTLSVSNAQLIQQLGQGEFMISTMQAAVAEGAIKDGAPVKMVYPPEGVPTCDMVSAVVRKAANPNAARLYWNWSLSKRGQSVWVNDLDGVSVREDLSIPKIVPADTNIWHTPLDAYMELRDKWVADWNDIFNYTS
jgi:iron(III) transport system substrate-binding protein